MPHPTGENDAVMNRQSLIPDPESLIVHRESSIPDPYPGSNPGPPLWSEIQDSIRDKDQGLTMKD
jgi:hypothetical protein